MRNIQLTPSTGTDPEGALRSSGRATHGDLTEEVSSRHI